MARDDPVRSQTAPTDTDRLPNLVTVVGRGVPSSFEIAVDGEIELVADEPASNATIVTENVVEGAIDVGVQRFRFSGEMANVHVVDWNGVPAPESSSTPYVHVDYGVDR
ncbi:hypothetical protein [Natronobacterium gregoryi]|uniref:Uncharacterized protein n=2 Tax=Natronobacterium gregoryi TaxID=44930 RepID=L0AE15_NATGS|nr:hypothetical protein [Natronobacterium gregoryi]AFZ71659.1 hypothetical protein Natgr_0403 [Natronobacterium gregoryi SP2]ELY66278.1 hypothetical protein C490_13124 [Natronobacterium gregoryi SP2]PLK18741.1 hypothetical protein CYV19_17135 [Natronobacterium gregoryi SP2]SFJ65013.1 hypothetical protein SAMN05443661_1523 [Natronobacterium gregoryi]